MSTVAVTAPVQEKPLSRYQISQSGGQVEYQVEENRWKLGSRYPGALVGGPADGAGFTGKIQLLLTTVQTGQCGTASAGVN